MDYDLLLAKIDEAAAAATPGDNDPPVPAQMEAVQTHLHVAATLARMAQRRDSNTSAG